MSVLRYFLIGSVALFGAIGFIGWMKKSPKPQQEQFVQEIDLEKKTVPQAPKPIAASPPKPVPAPPKPAAAPKAVAASTPKDASKDATPEIFPDIDRVRQLFALDSSKLPIVETVSYTSRVPWLKGRPAWIADYANHFETSRHFIARSLNRKLDYLTQKVSPGDRFNVFKKDKNINFHLLIDLSHCRMWFYYIDMDTQERVLLKTYRVGIGRVDAHKASGFLTPLGKYALGEKIAIYKPGTMGYFQDDKIEMIRVFGTRWIPFDKEIEGCTEGPKGLGLHGAPWSADPVSGQNVEDRSKIGKYDSDGCIRLASEDIEELFSIIITKPTTVELVKDFQDAKLPGRESTAFRSPQ